MFSDFITHPFTYLRGRLVQYRAFPFSKFSLFSVIMLSVINVYHCWVSLNSNAQSGHHSQVPYHLCYSRWPRLTALSPDVISRGCFGASFHTSSSKVGVSRQDLRLEVPRLEQAVLAAKEDVGDNCRFGFQGWLPAVDQRLANLIGLRLLKR